MVLPGVPGLHIGDDPVMRPADHGDRNIKISLPAQGIEPAQHRQRQGHILIAQGLKRQPDALVIADGQFFRGHLQAQPDLFTELFHIRSLLPFLSV